MTPRRFPPSWQVEQTPRGFKALRRGFSFCLPAVNGSGSSRCFDEQRRDVIERLRTGHSQ